MFGAYGVGSGEALWRALRLEDWIPSRWQEWFPDLDLEKALRLACTFFVEDCVQNQKRHGIAAYNKITAPKDMVLYPDYGHEGLPGFADRVFDFMAGL